MKFQLPALTDVNGILANFDCGPGTYDLTQTFGQLKTSSFDQDTNVFSIGILTDKMLGNYEFTHKRTFVTG